MSEAAVQLIVAGELEPLEALRAVVFCDVSVAPPAKRRYARPRPPEQRRQALALLDAGLTPGEVARRTLIPASTVQLSISERP